MVPAVVMPRELGSNLTPQARPIKHRLAPGRCEAAARTGGGIWIPSAPNSRDAATLGPDIGPAGKVRPA